MGITDLNGIIESHADTIRKWLAAKFEAANTGIDCKFISQGGLGTSHNADITTTDMTLLEREGEVFVKCYDGDEEELESSNDFVYKSHVVGIDIYGKHTVKQRRHTIPRVKDFIDQAVLDGQRDTFLKSRDNRDSGILGFRYYSIDWERVAEDGEAGITESLHGELFVLHQRART